MQAGQINLTVGKTLLDTLEHTRRMFEMEEFETRLSALESNELVNVTDTEEVIDE
jgi:hypothetical protein